MFDPLRHRRLVRVAVSGLVAAMTGCATAPSTTDVAPQGFTAVDDLRVVDCELPDRVKRVGGAVFLEPRPPIRATVADCRIRGGEYVAYDRANYETALGVWLPEALAGDPEAQTNVGEIYERGLGAEPNFAEAAKWYAKAAEAGNDRARFNLATLYEKGLGVPRDRLEALNLYRQVWGVPPDDIIFRSLADEEIAAERLRLQQQIDEKNQQIEYLQHQLLEDGDGPDAAVGRSMLENLENELEASVQALDALPPPAGPSVPSGGLVTPSGPELAERFRQAGTGGYHALIIGNQNYRNLEDLSSPLSDTDRVRQVLERNYGFYVTVVDDADRGTLMVAIADLDKHLGEDDNLLIYYSGHGACMAKDGADLGYWLPVDADPPPDYSDWVATNYVSEHLEILKARRVLVVVDSCYAGQESDAPGQFALEQTDPRLLELKLRSRSRLLLSSGQDRPVTMPGRRDHSVFADALLAELESNQTVLTGPDLYARLRERLRSVDGAGALSLEPHFTSIRFTGHEAGDFFFVPKAQ